MFVKFWFLTVSAHSFLPLTEELNSSFLGNGTARVATSTQAVS